MVVAITAVAGALCWIAMQITASGRTEYVDYSTMTVYASWLALFHLVFFMIPATLFVEIEGRRLRYVYYLIAVAVAVVWTVMLDGPEQPISYALAVLIGLACAFCWTRLLLWLRPIDLQHEEV